MNKIILSTLLISSLNAQSLKSTVDEVLSTNPILMERQKNYNFTKEDITNAQSGYYPKIDLSLGIGYEDNTLTPLGGPSGESGLSVYQHSLKYTQNIFKGFKTTYMVEKEEHKTTAAAYSYIEKANDTVFKMVESYLNVIKNKELLENSKENVDINDEILQKVRKLYDAGLTTLSEVNKIESSLALARSNFTVQENTMMDVVFNMRTILGRDLNVKNMQKPEVNFKFPDNIDEAAQYAIQNNPSLLISTYNIKLAQATYKEKKSSFYPHIDIELTGSMNENLNGIESKTDRLQAMAYLRYNIFNGFADSSALQKTRSLVHKETEVKNILRREVIEGLNLSWIAYEKLNQQLVHLTKYKDFSLKTLTLYSKEYDLGRRSLLDLLSAQNDFVGAKSQIINNQYGILFAQYRILDAMGELVSAITQDTDYLYSNVGLRGEAPENEDSLPVDYDRDKDLIVDEKDLCSNSTQEDMRNIYGCAKVQDAIQRIERYNNFLFDSEETQLNDAGTKRLSDLVTQIELYGWEHLSFDVLGHAQNEDLNESKLHDISKQRAEFVKKELIKMGAISENIDIFAQGDKAPSLSNEYGSFIEVNNRVDIIVKELYK